jgi:uncharacterized membrane protein YfcA
VLFRERHSIDIPGLKWALVGQIPGMLLGVVMLTAIPEKKLTLVFGLMVLIAVVLSAREWHPRPTSWTLLIAGTLSGLMGMTSSISGPPMAIVYQDTSETRLGGRFRVTSSPA